MVILSDWCRIIGRGEHISWSPSFELANHNPVTSIPFGHQTWQWEMDNFVSVKSPRNLHLRGFPIAKFDSRRVVGKPEHGNGEVTSSLGFYGSKFRMLRLTSATWDGPGYWQVCRCARLGVSENFGNPLNPYCWVLSPIKMAIRRI